jgi:hypothetical protein
MSDKEKLEKITKIMDRINEGATSGEVRSFTEIALEYGIALQRISDILEK